ncbi:dynamin family protein [Thalassobacillus pellis]|uniref:dynamin family protein n=1 Tax=Thalassobacillus pellis TaxID=748008 RepID=UPI001960D9F0|nr:dynamin family protein [Thalassobacillus pellis]MBM7552556.1 small GTP-binding protein [Thalassobacillus pellis]
MSVITEISLKEQLSIFHETLRQHDQEVQADKVLDLIEKWESKELMIGFAGHFSAGKSTMINKLVEEEILPSSPIPTSANVVKLRGGNDYVRVFYRNENPAHFDGKHDIETIKALCREGDEILSLEISQSDAKLPHNVSLLDTPGVDSTNDADRVITESSIHLMDYMYYVMDYNHVQSEVNLTFLREMQRKNIAFSIVINQVDKHQDNELTIKDFKESVERALANWGIHPENIYYTSMKQENLSWNDIGKLKKDMYSIYQIADEEKMAKILASAETILTDSVESFAETFIAEEEEITSRIKELKDKIEQEARGEDAKKLVEELANRSEYAERMFQERVLSFFKNAYLMPSALREDAERFLIAMQPGFKVGWMFTKNKTNEEREARKQEFHKHLLQVIEKNLIWPLRDRLTELMESYQIFHPEIVDEIQNMKAEYPPENLIKLIESGAEVTGQYILVYTDRVAKDVKDSYRHLTKELWEKMKSTIEAETAEQMAEFENAQLWLDELEKSETRLSELETKKDAHYQTLNKALFESAGDHAIYTASAEKMLEARKKKVKYHGGAIENNQPSHTTITEDTALLTTSGHRGQSGKAALAAVDEVVDSLQEVPGFQSIIQQLELKKERLRDREFTVALFGAFSAGKSSFANALLKQKLLPVSPNPTTATINKIAPPDENYAHGTIQVKMKSEEELIEDVNEACDVLGIEGENFRDLLQKLSDLNEKDIQQLEHKQHAFLHALIAGYEESREQIGKTLTITLEEFPYYVADEKKSCYVEWMQVHYDCEWTRKGITLVDTPGADSVNARHTNVSFEYIKNADAILFVTYYNHPFSKADESFLTQLGRVKDVFSMDKMFFIINASDLAESESELKQVRDYIEQQLLKFQIRNPRIFPVSSLQALQNIGSSGIEAVKRHFYTFIEEEATEVLVRSIYHDFSRAKNMMTDFVQNASLKQEEREKMKDQFQEQEQQMHQVINELAVEKYETDIDQKIKKQIHYIHQRMMLNLHDMFKQHFNPATITASGKAGKTQIIQATNALLTDVTYELNQELRAVSLRMEAYLNKTASKVKEEAGIELHKVRNDFELATMEERNFNEPSFQRYISYEEVNMGEIFPLFRGTKRFFENNEKEHLKETLAGQIDPLLKKCLESSHQEYQQIYLTEWKDLISGVRKNWDREIDEFYRSLRYSLDNPIDVGMIKRKSQQLDSVLNEYE